MVGFCGHNNKPCCLTGRDWCRPPEFPYYRDWETRPGKNAYISGTLMTADGREVHKPDPRHPSPLDACYVSPPDVVSEHGDGWWQSNANSDAAFDMGHVWSEGHNWTINNVHAFRVRNNLTLTMTLPDGRVIKGVAEVVVR
jgi:hypothetical protein